MVTSGTISIMADSTEIFAQKLRRLVNHWPGTQKELAREVGVSPQQLSKYLSGTMPKPFRLLRLAQVLKADLVHLLNDKDESQHTGGADWTPVSQATSSQLLAEVSRRVAERAHELSYELQEAIHTPWEPIAIWLLSKAGITRNLPSLIREAIRRFKAIDRLVGEVRELLSASDLESAFVVGVGGAFDPRRVHPSHLIQEAQNLKERHPGILAVSYYVVNSEAPSFNVSDRDWNYRRAWLMAMLVTHESVARDPQYDPIRAALRAMRFIDDEGNRRDFGDMSKEFGEFEIGPPERTL